MSTATRTTSVRIEERDIRIFAGLFESRIMQRRHLTALYFDGKDAAAKERIGKKLLPGGFLQEQNRRRNPSEKAVYGLGKRGFEELKARGAIARYEQLAGNRFKWDSLEDRLCVSPRTVAHELAVMDVKAALTSAARTEASITAWECLTWPLLYQFGTGTRTVKPDGYIRFERIIDDETVHEDFVFLEVDRGTESLETLVGKVTAYRTYSGSDGFARFVGAEADKIHFRVAFVFGREGDDPSGAESRRNNFLDRACRDGSARHFVWTTTRDAVERDPLGAIWLCPNDYALALGNSPLSLDPAERARSRDAARDAIVREKTRAHRLFGDENANARGAP